MVHQLLTFFGLLYLLGYTMLVIEIAQEGGLHVALGHTLIKRDNYRLRTNFFLSILFFLTDLITWSVITKTPDNVFLCLVIFTITVYIIVRSYFQKEKETI